VRSVLTSAGTVGGNLVTQSLCARAERPCSLSTIACSEPVSLNKPCNERLGDIVAKCSAEVRLAPPMLNAGPRPLANAKMLSIRIERRSTVTYLFDLRARQLCAGLSGFGRACAGPAARILVCYAQEGRRCGPGRGHAWMLCSAGCTKCVLCWRVGSEHRLRACVLR
jgi:hypothetical protein